MSNSAAGNAILRYARLANGTLRLVGSFSTGGTGSGTGLNGASHTVNFGNAGSFLFASDAGSNDIAVFDVSSTGMKLIGRFTSNGTTPASIAVWDSTLYVLNEGSNTIAGFTIGANGTLNPIAGSTQSLTGSASDDAVDLVFRSGGTALFVPQKVSNVIDTFAVDGGVAGPAIAHSSNGTTPFGSVATANGGIINTEASGKVAGASAVSSYALGSDGSLSTVSGSVPNHQTAACWAALTHRGNFAFVANTGSNNISSYTVAPNGAVALTKAIAIEPNGSAPADIGVSFDDGFVYVVNSGTHTIGAFRTVDHGTLKDVQILPGLPATAIGISVR
ncbi:MAG TPA: beta-propeller fold lactonase family protein [Candidatus Baltobacteraceae bacterium]|nr:beta-propeller fold lactonase family protein [Candidatus Baltobacteraceae bacterium]